MFFSKLAVVSFGGAYALLAYMAQEVVDARGWLALSEMVDGLGLAETTPGPLILVSQFVGFLAAHRTRGTVDRTRPLCPHPRVARWDGVGDPDDAASFSCVRPGGRRIRGATAPVVRKASAR